MGKSKTRSPTGLNSWTIFFLLYINDLPGIINDISKPTMFADNTNIIITHSNLSDFKDEINIVIEKTCKQFQTNLLILNSIKTHYMQFMAKHKLPVDIHMTSSISTLGDLCNTE
jgi:hypothetical protein